MRRKVALVVGWSSLLVIIAAPAIADPWGTETTDTGAHPDANPHGYCFSSSVGPDAKPNMTDAEDNALEPTNANVTFDSSCNLSGTGETDVVWRVGDLAPGVLGHNYCEDFDGSYCDQYYNTLDMTEIAIGIDDEIDETSIACHELGHSVGLTHGGGSDDCMVGRASHDPPTELKYRRYGSGHHIPDHINAWF